ncbi:MAG: polymer-forming cytoskeletal protein [Candidatus Pacebacteria bacterium]|nr:polymer-forming cytoskeletal protein [Candidatus Paceibacterota bacterium]
MLIRRQSLKEAIKMLKEGEFCKVVRRDHEGNIGVAGDVVVCKGVFVKGSIRARSGYVRILSGAAVRGNVYAGIAVEIEEGGLIIGDVDSAHALTNFGVIRGSVREVSCVRNFGEITGDIKCSSVPNNGWTLISGSASKQARVINRLWSREFTHLKEKT